MEHFGGHLHAFSLHLGMFLSQAIQWMHSFESLIAGGPHVQDSLIAGGAHAQDSLIAGGAHVQDSLIAR
jgi:hypothetical protein